MTRRISTRYSAPSTIIYVTVIALALLLHPTVVSLAASGVIELPKTGQTKCYDASGTEISCVGTGQDGDIQAGVAWPTPRFTDNGNETVTDNLTGLMWTQNANPAGNSMTWQQALDYVKTLNTGSHTDWRLPNVEELRSLVDYSQTNPSLPPGHPFTNVVASDYWSSTTVAGSPSSAWIVYMGSGFVVDGYNKSVYSNYAWPVRAGQCGSLGDSVICLPKTGQTKCYDTTGGNEISCAGTGQDGDIQAGVAWPSPRFTDNGNGTVTDNLTGLMWTKNANLAGTYMNWQQALDYVKTLNTGGHTDWRLPNFNELESLVGYSQFAPALPLGNPFTNVQSYYYWSSTTSASFPSLAWIVYVDGGYVYYYNKSYNSYYAWPVRAGQVGGSFDTSTTTTTVPGTETTTTTTTSTQSSTTTTSVSPVSTTTTTTPSGTPCPAKTALGEQARELQPLRAFRDRVMKRSNQGREYAELYYRNALEISSLLETHPKLKGESQRLILKLLPTVQALLAQKEAMIDAGNVTQATALLDNLSALGSPSLSADLLMLKKEMQSGRLFEELHISVAGRER